MTASTTKKGSRVMRISGDNFNLIRQLKVAFAERHGMKKATYDTMLGQALTVARALMEGREIYVVDDRVYTDLAKARGDAILLAVRKGEMPRMPRVLVELGEDKGP